MNKIDNNLYLEIKGFQLIKDAKLTFEPGLTTISGESGNGKSSLFRAIKHLLLNPSKGVQNRINYNSNFMSVIMEYKGNVIEWRRTKKDSIYIINGKEHKKVGNTNLFKLLTDINTGFFYDENKNKVLNIEECIRDTLFPYSLTSSELFKLYENIFTVSESAKVFQGFKQEEDRLNKELNEKTGILDKNIEKITIIKELQTKVDKNNLIKKRDNLLKLNEDYSTLVNTIEEVGEILKHLDIVKDTEPIKLQSFDKLNNYLELTKAIRTVNIILEYLNILGNIKGTELISLDTLNNYIKLRDCIREIENILAFQVDNVRELKYISFSNIEKYIKIKDALLEFKNLSKFCKIISNTNKIESISLDKLNNYIIIKNNIKEVEEILSEVKEIKEEISQIDDEIKNINKKLEGFEDYRCKECGQLIICKDGE